MASKTLFTKNELEELIEDYCNNNANPLSWCEMVIEKLNDGFKSISTTIESRENSVQLGYGLNYERHVPVMTELRIMSVLNQGLFVNSLRDGQYVATLDNDVVFGHRKETSNVTVLETCSGDDSVYIKRNKDSRFDDTVEISKDLTKTSTIALINNFDITSFVQGFVNRIKNIKNMSGTMTERMLLEEHYASMSTYHGLSISSLKMKLELGNDLIGRVISLTVPMLETTVLGKSHLYTFELLSDIVEGIVKNYCKKDTKICNFDNYEIFNYNYSISSEALLNTLIACRDNMSKFITTRLIPEMIKRMK